VVKVGVVAKVELLLRQAPEKARIIRVKVPVKVKVNLRINTRGISGIT